MDGDRLTEQEIMLLEQFRELSPAQQEGFQDFLEELAEAGEPEAAAAIYQAFMETL